MGDIGQTSDPMSNIAIYMPLLYPENQTCHPACDQNGCWGPGDHECVNCIHYSQNGLCVEQCGAGYYKSETMCLPCHSLCKTCTGSGPHQCSRCKYFSFRGNCVKFRQNPTCSESMLRRCMPCVDILTEYKRDRDGIVPK